MSALICGSLAFDTITTFPGRFAEQILPDQVHILNVSFLVPTLRREFGGCAGNIAYTLHQLGGKPMVMAALGRTARDYLARLDAWGLHRARARDDRQLHRAGDHHHRHRQQPDHCLSPRRHAVGARHAACRERDDIRLAHHCARRSRRDARSTPNSWQAAGIPFIFDPGQGLPMFDGEELRNFVAQATWVAVNDYEGRMLCERTGRGLEELSRSHLQGIIVTLGAQGCDLWIQGERTRVAGVTATEVVDPPVAATLFAARCCTG